MSFQNPVGFSLKSLYCPRNHMLRQLKGWKTYQKEPYALSTILHSYNWSNLKAFWMGWDHEIILCNNYRIFSFIPLNKFILGINSFLNIQSKWWQLAVSFDCICVCCVYIQRHIFNKLLKYWMFKVISPKRNCIWKIINYMIY